MDLQEVLKAGEQLFLKESDISLPLAEQVRSTDVATYVLRSEPASLN
jgi:hypothetical protein